MYIYDQYDQTLVNERVEQFRDQTQRYLSGQLSEDDYRPLRLMNGLYVQTHAPMLRVAIPYGLLSSTQTRKLAHIARAYDKDYGHITTRQNIQYNWPKLEDVPDILAELATVQMHAIQTSGNCIRNVTSDHLAGVSSDELEDPRPYCEIIRQWSTLHPEFAFLPRKFKIAVTGATKDRAASQVHDIGLHLVKNPAGETGFEVLVGGGLGRTPIIGETIREFLPKQHLLSYLEAILRVYNRLGRRDNKYKSRIKILVKSLGKEAFAKLVEDEWQYTKDALVLDDGEIERLKSYFQPPHYRQDAASDETFGENLRTDSAFARWVEHNVVNHKVAGYKVAYISLKSPILPAGDITGEQLDIVADLADQFNFGEVRTTHSQNMLFAHVQQADLYPLWQALEKANLATPNIGTFQDMIVCPGLDFCSLANAGTLDMAKEIYDRFDNLDHLYDLGELYLNISGCMNACGHQDVGHIGILGVDKKGEEWYQVTLGGSPEEDATLGDRLGKAFSRDRIVDALTEIIEVYVENRRDDETFLTLYRRIGITPFKERVYASH